jgi:uracil DNA glycosylase
VALDEEEQEEKEVVVTVTKYAMGAGDMGLQIVRVDELGKETRIQMLADVQVKMSMDFLIGNVPKTVVVCNSFPSPISFSRLFLPYRSFKIQ